MLAAAISCCSLILIFITDVGGYDIELCADFKNLKLKLKLGMPSGRSIVMTKAAAAARCSRES